MIRPSRALRAAVVLASASLALTACGGSSDKSSSGGSSASASSSASSGSATGNGPLTLGTLLPQTGDLAFLGPPEFAGVDAAVADINAAGGVNGKPVLQAKADSGDGTPDIAGQSVDKLLNANADVIIGAASSSVSLSVIDKITGAGVVQFSPANTSPAFDTYNDHGLYFRTAPSDALQGAVLGNLVTQDGHQNVAILARQDSYGEGLANQVEKTIKEKGGTVATKQLYSADATNYTAEVNKVAAVKPDALILIAFDETKKLIPQLIAKGVGPKNQQTYFVDGNTADYSKVFPKGTLTGVKATFPSPPTLDPAFKAKLLKINPKLTDFTYAPNSYDAAVISALAASEAKDVSGKAIAAHIIDVTTGGTKCTTYAQCLALVKKGTDIDYDGQSGPTDMNSTGSPSKATIGIQKYSSGNTYKQIDSVSGVLN